MQQLGTRVVEDTLENRIEKALADALVVCRNAGLEPAEGTWCGLGEAIPGGAIIRLSMQDVSRIAGAAARAWF